MASREATLVDGALARPRPDERRRAAAVHRRRQQPARVSHRGQALAARQILAPGSRPSPRSPSYQRSRRWKTRSPAAAGSGPLPVNASAWEADSRGCISPPCRSPRPRTPSQLAAMSGARSSGLVTEAVLAGGVGLARRRRVGLPARLVRPQGHRRPDPAARQRPGDGGGAAAAGGRTAAAAARTWTCCAESPPPRRQQHRGDLPDRAVRSPPCRRRRSRPPSSRRGCARGSTRSS